MTGPLIEFVAGHHVKKLLEQAERDHMSRCGSEDERSSRLTGHLWRSGTADHCPRPSKPGAVLVRSHTAAIDRERPTLAKAR